MQTNTGEMEIQPQHRVWKSQQALSTYNLSDFAVKHFQDGAPLTFARFPLHWSLLKHEIQEDVKVACVVNVAILRFMTDLPEPSVNPDRVVERFPEVRKSKGKHQPGTTFKRKVKEAKSVGMVGPPPLSVMDRMTTNLEKVQFIVGTGIYRPNLRDEIYCQLCRQLTDNVSRTSFSRGWILMGLCVGCFPPSRTFINYLKNFLRLGPPGYGEYCAARLQRTLEVGARRQPPPSLEVEAVKSKAPISLQVTTMDGTEHTLMVDSAVRCEDLCSRIKERLAMKSAYGFSVYVVGLDQIANWGSGNESVLDSISIAEQYAKSKGRDDSKAWKLYIRRDLFPPLYDPSTEPIATDLTYSQIVGGLSEGEYKCDEVNEIVEIVAKRYYIENGPEISLDDLKRFLPRAMPRAVLTAFTENELIFTINEMFESVPEIRNRATASAVKEQLVHMAMTKWPRNFSRNFDACLVSGRKVPKGNVILAVNSIGVYIFADNPSRPFFFSLEYPRITSVGSGRSQHDLQPMVTISSGHKTAFTFKTNSADEIRDLVLSQLELYNHHSKPSNAGNESTSSDSSIQTN